MGCFDGLERNGRGRFRWGRNYIEHIMGVWCVVKEFTWGGIFLLCVGPKKKKVREKVGEKFSHRWRDLMAQKFDAVRGMWWNI